MGQVGQVRGRLALVYRQCALNERLCLRVPLHNLIQDRQANQAFGHMTSVRPQFFPYRQHALKDSLGLGVATLVLVEPG